MTDQLEAFLQSLGVAESGLELKASLGGALQDLREVYRGAAQ